MNTILEVGTPATFKHYSSCKPGTAIAKIASQDSKTLMMRFIRPCCFDPHRPHSQWAEATSGIRHVRNPLHKTSPSQRAQIMERHHTCMAVSVKLDARNCARVPQFQDRLADREAIRASDMDFQHVESGEVHLQPPRHLASRDDTCTREAAKQHDCGSQSAARSRKLARRSDSNKHSVTTLAKKSKRVYIQRPPSPNSKPYAKTRPHMNAIITTPSRHPSAATSRSSPSSASSPPEPFSHQAGTPDSRKPDSHPTS